ncbi:RNase H family protein [Atopobacter phocae]|uniref:RNase H family protein n=1 Tax=Atopobacter phocae TaxID=136492 RepID=UPI00046F3C05|nr:RNase H family protein [Atopobacter phocae]
MIEIFTDAAVKKDSPYTAVAAHVLYEKKQYHYQHLIKESMDNHIAEFYAVYYSVQWLSYNFPTNERLFIHTDSQIVYQAISKGYVKKTVYKHLLEQIQKLFDTYPLVIIDWVPEKKNKKADELARALLNKHVN